MKRLSVLVLVLVLLGGALGLAFAQDDPANDGTSVYVTTQDYVSLREGPGRGFKRLAVVPAEVTLPVYGRTSDTRWVQVVYEGQYGWIATQFLVWSGNIIVLPVDGVNPAPFVRRAAALAVTFRDTPYYSAQITPEHYLGLIPKGTELELTGRVGELGFFRFQVRYNDQLVWVGSWDVRVTDGDYRRLLDLAYVFGYGRLIITFERNIAQAVGSYNQIRNVWLRLSQGDRLACQPIPPRIPLRVTQTDVAGQRTFLPAINALDAALQAINGAISAFEDSCANPNVVLTRDAVIGQINALADAERNLILAASLLEPLRRRNPLLGERVD